MLSSHQPECRFPTAWVVGALALTALVFARALGGELVYDDLLLIARNPTLESLSGLPRVLGRGYWDFLSSGQAESIGYWRPLPAAAHLLTWRLSGESVPALHALSLLAHLVATFAAARLAWALVPNVLVCVGAATLFGLHPVHVESVAWISALNDPLFGAFSMLSLASWAVWRRGEARGTPWVAALWFALALLSKEMGAAVLPLLLVLDLARVRGSLQALGLGAVRAYAPFLGVFAAYYLARAIVFASPLAGFDRVTTDFGVDAGRLVLLRVELLGLGAELLALPRDLRLFRPFRPELGWTDPAALRALVATGLVAALLVVGFVRRRSAALLVAGWLLASLAPVLLRVESLGRFPLSDRFLYLSAFAAAIGWALLVRRVLPPRAALVAVVALSLVAGWRSFARTGTWHDERTLFATEAAASPRSAYVQWGLGRVLLDEYQRTSAGETLREAIEVYERAQDLLVEAKQPGSDLFVSARDFLQVRLGYGWTQLFRARREGFRGSSAATFLFEELAQDLVDMRAGEQAARDAGIRVREQHLEIEQVQNALGVAYLFEGRLDEARRALNAAVQSNEKMPEAHQNLGRLAAAAGEPARALAHFERALKLRPGHFEDRLLIAQTRFELGQIEEAQTAALALEQEYSERSQVQLLLAAAALSLGDTSEGLRRLDRTLALDVNNAQAHYLRATALLARDRAEDALVELRRATELDAEHFEASHDLAALLLASGAQEAAREPLVRAFRLAPTEERARSLRAVLAQLEWRDPRVLFELTTIETERGDLDAAETWLDLGLQRVPADADLLFQKGRILRKRGRDDEALDAMQRSIVTLDTFVSRAELGHYFVELERAEDARNELERALELEPPTDWSAEQRAGAREGVQLLLQQLEK